MGFTFKEKGFDPKIPWFYYSCSKHGVEKLFFLSKTLSIPNDFSKRREKKKDFLRKLFKTFLGF